MGKQGLAEYDDNGYICALPDILSYDEIVDRLSEDFSFDERERDFSPELRMHAVMRLARFFTPLSQHLTLYTSIMLTLRQGYVARTPGTPAHIAYRQGVLARLSDGEHGNPNLSHINKACSFAFLGCSGTGKSYSIRHILRSIEQSIQHIEPVTVIQVVWLYVECPHRGNLRGLCLRILSALDKALETTSYRTLYGYRRNTVEELLLDIEQLFTVHAVGLLVIDEIQNLREAQQADKSAVTKFFVLLVNSVGVPVITVGTLGAASVFDSAFSNARRASGLGSILWYPLARGSNDDDEWPDFVRQLWRGQWTSTGTELTSEILDALYEETQGVLDLVVILYMLCQIQLIQLTALARYHSSAALTDETITVELIKSVAAEKFRLIAPLLSALRNGNLDALGDFDGLLAFHESMEVEFKSRLKEVPRRPSKPTPSASGPQLDKEEARQTLIRMGLASDLSEAVVANSTENGDLHLGSLLRRAAELLDGSRAAPAKQRRTSRRKQDAGSNMLQQLVAEAAAEQLGAYEALRRAGHCVPLSQDFPW
ncbi:ATP-binding protein [Sphingopyxis sp.]|uniref:ATP-binding protein n=1 Tax=Sphingopyxis sp. TaxID=1908224 RepID=UPI002D766821|nr:ATP-binding protein [Sphingopyxis sp.]HET6525173.1 ATP-binding protein [Sphingopyxis sp.]